MYRHLCSESAAEHQFVQVSEEEQKRNEAGMDNLLKNLRCKLKFSSPPDAKFEELCQQGVLDQVLDA